MLRPMLASLAGAPLQDPALVYEPKYDGIRALIEIDGTRPPVQGTRPPLVRIWSRLGNEKTNQFPEIVTALSEWAERIDRPIVLDGEIVALTAAGRPTGFQQLQGRIHLQGDEKKAEASRPSVAFIAFDLLRDGAKDLRERPLTDRRAALERLLDGATGPVLRLSAQVRGDGRALFERALSEGWEGLIAKQAASPYRPGKRTPEWRKLKIVRVQEFVVGGWTEPRQTRSHFGALLLGVYDAATPRPRRRAGSLIYVGHIGTGFDQRELARVMKLLRAARVDECPYRTKPVTNERPHWVRPTLVAAVKFTEWTADGKLRHPVYLGLRDDKAPEDVIREPEASKQPATDSGRSKRETRHRATPTSSHPIASPQPAPASSRSAAERDVINQLAELEVSRRDGTINLPGGDRLRVTNLHKPFWPKLKLTKGALFRYYVELAPYLLPVIADRPLVLKRFPDGIAGAPFYQHRAQDVPDGVRVETLPVAGRRPHVVGGDLKTLLQTTQLAAISQDPWFSRVSSLEFADHAALDLDPAPGVPFERVLDVARWIRDELQNLGANGAAKTSGSEGLHIYVPLPAGTTYELGLLYCQIIASLVSQKHPQAATTERSVRARGRRVYIDCLQNVLGKTLASAYSARASEYAGVSAPVTWKEVEEGVRPEDFTIQTMPSRVAAVGDLWSPLRSWKGADLSRATRYLDRGRRSASKAAPANRR